MLEKGVPMEELALVLGNSLRVCEKHYAKWVQSRQDAVVGGAIKLLGRILD